MITFVYRCICLLIVCCQTAKSGNDEFGYSNDAPDISPETETVRYQLGAEVVMKCPVNHHLDLENITWEFKHCKSNHHLGISCEADKLNYLEGEWKKLDYNRKRKKLLIKKANNTDAGLYKCLLKDSIIKIYVLELVDEAAYSGPPPRIISLIPSSNSTITPNTPLVIQCKGTSAQAAVIRWFKECNGQKCDVRYDNHCYCHLYPSSNSAFYNNTYISKLNIYNFRDVDSATYFCLIISVWGEDHKNITLKVDDSNYLYYEDKRYTISLLFLIPVIVVLVPIIIWRCFYKKKKKNRRLLNEHQKQLINPVVEC